MKVNKGIITLDGREEYFTKTIESLNSKDIKEIRNIRPAVFAHIKAWEILFSDEPDYAILFQDDLITGKNLIPAIELILEKIRPEFITFYSNRKQILEHEEGIFEINPKYFLGELAVAMSLETFKKYKEWVYSLRFMQVLDYRDWRHHDCLLRAFLIDKNIKTYATNPSLVQHIGVKSTMGHPWKIGNITRQSRNFIGERDILKVVKKWLNINEI